MSIIGPPSDTTMRVGRHVSAEMRPKISTSRRTSRVTRVINRPFLGCRKELFGENGRDYLTAQVFAPWAIDMGRQQLLGVAFAASRERLKQAAEHRGCQRLANVNGCPT